MRRQAILTFPQGAIVGTYPTGGDAFDVSSVAVFVNDGYGIFTRQPNNYDAGLQPMSLALADFDGDHCRAES